MQPLLCEAMGGLKFIDGLRGIAAMMALLFSLAEAHECGRAATRGRASHSPEAIRSRRALPCRWSRGVSKHRQPRGGAEKRCVALQGWIDAGGKTIGNQRLLHEPNYKEGDPAHQPALTRRAAQSLEVLLDLPKTHDRAGDQL
jgi:hypothetical protein